MERLCSARDAAVILEAPPTQRGLHLDGDTTRGIPRSTTTPQPITQGEQNIKVYYVLLSKYTEIKS